MNNRTADWLYEKKIAHRGLHNSEYAENSMSAFRKAIENDYNIEIDVQLNKDGDVVIFHDANLKRVCGIDKKISEVTTAELKDCKLLGTEDSIPLLTELLAEAEGKVGLLVELKDFKMGEDNKLAAATHEVMKDYKGDYAVQAFNPWAMRWYYKNAPEVYRGQLATMADSKLQKALFYPLWSLKFLNYNKPDFVAYNIKYIPNKYIDKAKEMGAKVVAWTVTSSEHKDTAAQYCDNIIFEEV
jgi:glycerophosphoryl diester phosphodiesterase